MFNLTEQQVKDVMFEEYIDIPGAEVVEVGEWEDNMKYSNKRAIVSYEGKFYAFGVSRSGSWHSDYYYEWFTEGAEVVPREKVITIWEPVR